MLRRRSMNPLYPVGLLVVASLTACQKAPSAKALVSGKSSSAAAEPLHQAPAVTAGANAPSTSPATPGSAAASVAATTPNAASTQTAKPAAVAPEAPACQTLTFHHVPHPGHQSDEECSNHSNQLTLPAPSVGAILKSTVCVRLNGKPVAHQFLSASREIQFGPIAGPKDVVAIRYCTRPVLCDDPCIPARDEFVDALAGTSEDSTEEAASGAQDAERQLSARIKAELDGYGTLARFTGWQSKAPAIAAAESCSLKKEPQLARRSKADRLR